MVTSGRPLKKREIKDFGPDSVRGKPRDRNDKKRRMTDQMGDVRKVSFLVHFAEHGVIGAACLVAEVSRSVVLRWRENDPEFSDAFHYAQQEAIDKMEKEAFRRAVEGVQEPVFYRGEVVGTITKYSDTLLTLLLKGHLPQKYRDRIEHSTNPDEPMTLKLDFSKLTDRELKELERLFEKLEEEENGED